MKQNIVIIDYGMGNLRSVENKFRVQNCQAQISEDPEIIAKADKLVLPGVGHFANGMKNLKEKGILDVLQQKVILDKTPILGICLGMQLFTNGSEEGDVEGLGWIEASTKKFEFDFKESFLKVPHMGWNSLRIKKEHDLVDNVWDDDQFYFVHSYYVECNKEEDILTETQYGQVFTSSIQKENIIGVQFHPEKSHDVGAIMITNFVEKCSESFRKISEAA
ncbi:MAG: imidazole glycerol phosphate synthase subunit HisH [Bacteroidota bacterium]